MNKQWPSQSTKKVGIQEIENGLEEDPIDNVPFHTEIKGKIIEEPKDKISVPILSKIDQERDTLPLPSLHKTANPYRPPIPLPVVLKRTIKTSH